ncbi:HAD family hydrolase [Actinomadura harenae]|uniref:HAD family phosphatase n=1 Tax=Actinomadura harenae TaxID=2483351 RepID=A0A3M2LPZ3_9ACTN|nr:HAD family phosphatase [Actinomadura harenae]RMI38613.1 HAD family phosphatase [Actinomadura harenae]
MIQATGPAVSSELLISTGIQAVVFDFDGTLADTTPSNEQALRAALCGYGLDLDHGWYCAHVGLSIHDLLAVLPGGRDLPHEEIIRRSRTLLLASLHMLTPITGVVALLHDARRAGLRCAVASGASRVLVHPGLDALNLRHQFTAVVTREDVVRGKPAPDLYLTAARRLDVLPDRCLAVDDAPDGIAAARVAGMHAITISNGRPVAADDARPTPPTDAASGRASGVA